MLDTVTSERFAAHVGDVFRMQVDASRTIDVELIAVEASAAAARDGTDGRRPPFAVLFRGPREPIFPQRMYRLEHATLGALDIFLVPIGFDDRGLRYEAIFG